MGTVLQTRELSIGYKPEYPLITGINLRLERGLVTAMVGRNGAGKSTLIKTLTGNLKPLEGTVKIEGEDLKEIDKKRLSCLVALVNTDPHMAGGLRVRELVGLGRIPYIGRLGIPGREDREMIAEAINSVGIGHKADCFVGQLSDGERQKAMVARGLVQDTPVIIMDEPFSFLDVAARLELMDLLNRLAKDRGKAILYSTHEVTQALKTADRVWMFVCEGVEEKIEEGTPRQLIDKGLANKIFPESKVIFDNETLEFKTI